MTEHQDGKPKKKGRKGKDKTTDNTSGSQSHQEESSLELDHDTQVGEYEVTDLEAFVMMPSGTNGEYENGKKEADFVYKHIVCGGITSASERLGKRISVFREVDNRSTGSITANIVKRTVSADLAIVDITGMNPNVFFELGVRYAVRDSVTVLLRRADVRIPFDITAYRAISYDPLDFETAATQLSEAVIQAFGNNARIRDSLIYDVFPEMEVRIPDVYESSGEQMGGTNSIMPWREFWERLETIVRTIRDVVHDGRYVPDIVLGVSNGGLFVADILGRLLFQQQPKLSLWADRNAGLEMFDNPFNESLVKIMTENRRKGNKMEILLVDDIVASGQTSLLARQFLEKRLADVANIRFLAMFSRNEQYRSIISGFLLYEDERIPVREHEVASLMHTDRKTLPYHKDIRSS